MRLPQRLATWIDFGVSLLAAVYLASFAVVLWKIKLDPEDKLLATRRNTIVYAGLTLAAALFIGAILRAVQQVTRGGQRGRYLSFDTPGGRVAIRASGVEEALTRAVRAMDEVADASISLVLPRDAEVPTEVRVRCRLYERPDIIAVQGQVRAVVSDRYVGMFPGQTLPPVQVGVENFVFERPGPKAPPAPELEASGKEEGNEGEPFRPQYPVGDSD